METTTQTLTTYNVDPSHTSVQFKVRHLGFTKVTGRFTDFDAVVHMEPGNLETLETEATIKTASVTTGEDKRDDHLRSDDFFNAEKYPELTFRSTGVREVKGDSFKLEGQLTIRDATHTIELDGEYLGEATDPWGGDRVAFEARTKINRYDYGLKWNQALEAGGFLVGEDVEIILNVQAVQAD